MVCQKHCTTYLYTKWINGKKLKRYWYTLLKLLNFCKVWHNTAFKKIQQINNIYSFNVHCSYLRFFIICGVGYGDSEIWRGIQLYQRSLGRHPGFPVRLDLGHRRPDLFHGHYLSDLRRVHGHFLSILRITCHSN